MISSFGPHHRVLEAEKPRLLPLLPDVGSVQLAAPTAAEDGRSVIGVIPHEVEVLVGLEPLGDGGDLPVVESAVEVARHVGVDLVTMDTNQPQTLFPAKRWCAPFLKTR